MTHEISIIRERATPLAGRRTKWLSVRSVRGLFCKDAAVTPATIAAPEAVSFTTVNGIDDRGEIAGIYLDADQRYHGFRLRKGSLPAIDVPGACYTGPADINDRGQIVGGHVSTRREGG